MSVCDSKVILKTIRQTANECCIILSLVMAPDQIKKTLWRKIIQTSFSWLKTLKNYITRPKQNPSSPELCFHRQWSISLVNRWKARIWQLQKTLECITRLVHLEHAFRKDHLLSSQSQQFATGDKVLPIIFMPRAKSMELIKVIMLQNC